MVCECSAFRARFAAPWLTMPECTHAAFAPAGMTSSVAGECSATPRSPLVDSHLVTIARDGDVPAPFLGEQSGEVVR